MYCRFSAFKSESHLGACFCGASGRVGTKIKQMEKYRKIITCSDEYCEEIKEVSVLRGRIMRGI